jgi:hypothetical protein
MSEQVVSRMLATNDDVVERLGAGGADVLDDALRVVSPRWIVALAGGGADEPLGGSDGLDGDDLDGDDLDDEDLDDELDAEDDALDEDDDDDDDDLDEFEDDELEDEEDDDDADEMDGPEERFGRIPGAGELGG